MAKLVYNKFGYLFNFFEPNYFITESFYKKLRLNNEILNNKLLEPIIYTSIDFSINDLIVLIKLLVDIPLMQRQLKKLNDKLAEKEAVIILKLLRWA